MLKAQVVTQRQKERSFRLTTKTIKIFKSVEPETRPPFTFTLRLSLYSIYSVYKLLFTTLFPNLTALRQHISCNNLVLEACNVGFAQRKETNRAQKR